MPSLSTTWHFWLQHTSHSLHRLGHHLEILALVILLSWTQIYADEAEHITIRAYIPPNIAEDIKFTAELKLHDGEFLSQSQVIEEEGGEITVRLTVNNPTAAPLFNVYILLPWTHQPTGTFQLQSSKITQPPEAPRAVYLEESALIYWRFAELPPNSTSIFTIPFLYELPAQREVNLNFTPVFLTSEGLLANPLLQARATLPKNNESPNVPVQPELPEPVNPPISEENPSDDDAVNELEQALKEETQNLLDEYLENIVLEIEDTELNEQEKEQIKQALQALTLETEDFIQEIMKIVEASDLVVDVPFTSTSKEMASVRLESVNQQPISAQVVEVTEDQILIRGNALPYAFVTIGIYSDQLIFTTQADENGNWQITARNILPEGQHEIRSLARHSATGEITDEMKLATINISLKKEEEGFNIWLPIAVALLLLILLLIAFIFWKQQGGATFPSHQEKKRTKKSNTPSSKPAAASVPPSPSLEEILASAGLPAEPVSTAPTSPKANESTTTNLVNSVSAVPHEAPDETVTKPIASILDSSPPIPNSNTTAEITTEVETTQTVPTQSLISTTSATMAETDTAQNIPAVGSNTAPEITVETDEMQNAPNASSSLEQQLNDLLTVPTPQETQPAVPVADPASIDKLNALLGKK